jgi:8-oxo-dGTP pyrophosphatase MutT (NUDIX family)
MRKGMEREHRISAGAVIIQDDQILLARYKNTDGNTYLVGPGGGVQSNEGLYHAAIREVREETGLEVRPFRILFVEDLIYQRHRIEKIWLLCHFVGGQLARTPGAIEEGILEAGWYSKAQLQNEVVYPPTLMSYDWKAFFNDIWEAKYLDIRETY